MIESVMWVFIVLFGISISIVLGFKIKVKEKEQMITSLKSTLEAYEKHFNENHRDEF